MVDRENKAVRYKFSEYIKRDAHNLRFITLGNGEYLEHMKNMISLRRKKRRN